MRILIEAVVHHFRVAAGQITSSASVDKKGVSGNEMSLGQKTLTAGGMSRRMQDIKADFSD